MLAMYVAACLRDLEGETKTNEKAVTMTTEGDVLTTRDLEATSVSTSMPKIRLMRPAVILFLPFVTSDLTHHPSLRTTPPSTSSISLVLSPSHPPPGSRPTKGYVSRFLHNLPIPINVLDEPQARQLGII